MAIIGVSIVFSAVAVAVAAPVLAPHDFKKQQLSKALRPPVWASGADRAHLLGTDQLGRDLLSRIIYGARTSLLVGAGGVLIAGTLGVAVGLVAGSAGRRTDDAIMRIVDVQLSFPPILLVIAIMAFIGQSLLNVVVVLGLVTWVQYARVVRGMTLAIREHEFVEGARALGASRARLVLRHVLPGVVPATAVIATVNVSTLILAEASLSFLGLGVQPPTPAWGTMLAEGREVFRLAWWNAVFPGLAILLTVLGVNMLGDALDRGR
jgi:peptide/nickel transport system permease protein